MNWSFCFFLFFVFNCLGSVETGYTVHSKFLGFFNHLGSGYTSCNVHSIKVSGFFQPSLFIDKTHFVKLFDRDINFIMDIVCHWRSLVTFLLLLIVFPLLKIIAVENKIIVKHPPTQTHQPLDNVYWMYHLQSIAPNIDLAGF